ncbi:MAG: O-antigen ligase family protein [Flavobacterium sp.]|uniref:O-antigen ligase family protein n=1 Tax=Flavobacterium sp. TaxID=239 RepID=UPI003BDED9BC
MKERKYITLILLHALIGIILYFFNSLSIVYAICIPAIGLYYIMKNQNKNNEVLFVSAYIVGSEVFLRMTGGSLLYESAKYEVMIFLALGMFYSGFSKNAIPYWIYLLLLLPGVFIAVETLNLETNLRKAIAFNISGPICLGIASIYCYNRKILLSQLSNILLTLALPVFSTTIYLILYAPNLKDVLMGTGSNMETSGGFGPNQVATVLGIGMFIFFSRLLLESKTKLLIIVNLVVLFNITYRGFVTFSRGGMLTGFIIIILLLVYVYFNVKTYKKIKLLGFFSFMIVALIFTWLYTSNQTGGLIDKRYSNQDAAGRVKETNLTGREEIWDSEIADFIDHPVFGIGVGKALEVRQEKYGGVIIASHSEVSRTIAEHGTLGIIALLIVLFTPFFLNLNNKQHIYMISLLLFWLLTISHSAMRIAAPAFIYSLTLLKVFIQEEPSIPKV